MPRQDSVDFAAAFAFGTALGIGAALLLKPRRSPRERVRRQLKPYGKQMRRSYGHLARGIREGSGATSELGVELVGAGREFLGEFREEVADILDQARAELRDLVGEQVETLGKRAKKASRHARL